MSFRASRSSPRIGAEAETTLGAVVLGDLVASVAVKRVADELPEADVDHHQVAGSGVDSHLVGIGRRFLTGK